MYKLLPAILLVALVAHAAAQQPEAAPPITGEIQVFFSPKGGCTDAIVREISAAKTEILVQAYSFTSAPIAKALVEAHKQGINVRVILDSDQRTAKYSEADYFQHEGIDTWIDAAHAIAHNKVMVIDGQKIITGSFNFTKAAEEKNAENLLIIHSPELARKYIENWEKHLAHSERYEKPQPTNERND